MKNGKLRIEELALLLQCSTNTINTWYRFKSHEPDSEYAKMLPEFEQNSKRGTRYWKQSDIPKFIEFRTKLPIGRKGVMGKVTQKYNKHTKGGKNGSSEDAVRSNQ